VAAQSALREGAPAMFGHAPDQCPLLSVPDLSQLKSGRTAAPRLPHIEQTKRGPRSESLTSSGHRSPLIAIEWLQRSIWAVSGATATICSSSRNPKSGR
jgi:hypothetical protein